MNNTEIIKELEEAIVLNREARTKNNDAMCHAKNALMGGDCKITDSPAYKQGLEEAWEIATKIGLESLDGGYTRKELKSIFGNDSWINIFKNMSIHEVKEKIEAWEKEQAKPKLGDVVVLCYKDDDTKTNEIYLSEDPNNYHVLNGDLLKVEYSKKYWTIEKTGKHFDIQSMLDEIG